MLVFSRIITPGSKLSSFESSRNFLEPPECSLHQVYRALEVIAKENDIFQSELYKNSQSVIERKKKVLYYDCTNRCMYRCRAFLTASSVKNRNEVNVK